MMSLYIVAMMLVFISVESKCGYKGLMCCESGDGGSEQDRIRPCIEGSCVTGPFDTSYGQWPNMCCPRRGEGCCDEFGNVNCCNPNAPYCLGGFCQNIPRYGMSTTSRNTACKTDRHCCAEYDYGDKYCTLHDSFGYGICTKCREGDNCEGIGCTNYDETGYCTECCPEFPRCLAIFEEGRKGCTNAVIGRPYNLANYKDLRANIINNCDDDDVNEEYIDMALSEHASIGTFNKFCIELMNFGAPLWFLELSQKAALDEINHTKIMLDVLNGNSSDNCIEIGKFPNHEIQFNRDCDAVSLDVVSGGCFGETESSINTMKKTNEIKELYFVAFDEVRHSALAWISAKWMINNCQNIQIQNKKWWENKLKYSGSAIINKIYQQFWNFKGNDYKNLYKIVHDMLYDEVSSIHQKEKN